MQDQPKGPIKYFLDIFRIDLLSITRIKEVQEAPGAVVS